MSKLVIDKHQVLSDCELKLEIYQKGGIKIGTLSINLSEYAGSGVITERYLLQDCKFNSTIKVPYSKYKLAIHSPPLSS